MIIRNLKFAVVVLGGAMAMYSCCGNKSSQTADVHAAQNSLDWKGTYSGVLPCADCSGIDTELTLNDSTFVLISQYMSDENLAPDTITGSFVWEENNVRLSGLAKAGGSELFKVEENRVRLLDLEGNTVTGELENNYILTKNGNPLVENKRWKLVELYQQPVTGSAETTYIIFHSAENRVEAKANCNSISMGYKIQHEFRITFQAGLMTLMACPDDNLEQKFLEMLGETDNLSCDGQRLTLNKARMAPLGVFEVVEQ